MEADSDRILGLTAFGVGAAEIMTSVQIAMNAELPCTALRDTILAHPTSSKALSLVLILSFTAKIRRRERGSG